MSQRIVEITVKGEMGTGLRDAFEDVDLAIVQGVTRLRVNGSDAAALHGILDRLESFGLELLELHTVSSSARSSEATGRGSPDNR